MAAVDSKTAKLVCSGKFMFAYDIILAPGTKSDTKARSCLHIRGFTIDIIYVCTLFITQRTWQFDTNDLFSFSFMLFNYEFMVKRMMIINKDPQSVTC